MTKSRFDSRLEAWQDPDEPIADDFWERRSQAQAHAAAVESPGYVNPDCPDPESHWVNAADRLFPGVVPLQNQEQDEAVNTAAMAEYRACEGH